MSGLAQGVRDGKSAVSLAARAVVAAALNAAKAEIDPRSPSRKFAELGMNCVNYSKVVTDSARGVTASMLDTAKGELSTLSGLLSDDIDADPVIRPVLDLSDVTSGARAIGSIIPRNSTIDVGATSANANAASASMKAVRAGQKEALPTVPQLFQTTIAA